MKLGDLFVSVSAKGVGKVGKGIDQVEKKATVASKAMGMLKGAIMAIGTAVVIRAIKNVITTFIDYTVQIDKFTKQTGLAAVEIQRLVYAAEQEHSSLEALNKGLFNLTVRLGYAGDEIETYLRYFRALGIEYKKADGTLRDTYDVFLDIADVTAKGKLSTEELAAVTQLFGARAGKELIPLLKKGRHWFKEMGNEAERLGIILDEKTIKQGKAFSDEMLVLNKTAMGLKYALGEELLPIILDISNALKVVVKQSTFLVKIWRELWGGERAQEVKNINERIAKYQQSLKRINELYERGSPQWIDAMKRLNAAVKQWDESGKWLNRTLGTTNEELIETKKLLEELQPILFLDIDYAKQRTEQGELYNDALRKRIELLYGEVEGIKQVALAEGEQTDVSQEAGDILNVLSGAYSNLNVSLLSNANAFHDWASSLVSALMGVIIKLTALAAIIKLLEWLGVPAGALLKLGSKIGLFQTPTGDFWAYQEGRDFGKFFFSGVQSRLDSLTSNVNIRQQQTILKIYAEPGIIVEKMSNMPMTYKTKFNRDVTRKAELIEE